VFKPPDSLVGDQLQSLTLAVAVDGFAFIDAPVMRAVLASAGGFPDWDEFCASWGDLALDQYMADGGRYRRRRHAVFRCEAAGAIVRQPHQPHYQSLDYNPLNGGIERWFEPIDDAMGRSASLTTVLAFCRRCFSRLSQGVSTWHIEVHQFRIEARPGMQGLPTPEGMHRDGVDHVLVLLIRRENIAQGTTTVHDLDGGLLGSFTLMQPFDAALVDDRRVLHGVTPVEPLDASSPAFRDVLVVTFRCIESN